MALPDRRSLYIERQRCRVKACLRHKRSKAKRFAKMSSLVSRRPVVVSTISSASTDWVLEIKHDGYRLQVRRDGDKVRLFTRRGYDCSKRYPTSVRTAVALRCTSFTIDDEAVMSGPDGVAILTPTGPAIIRARGEQARPSQRTMPESVIWLIAIAAVQNRNR
jgi:hypothetical protein